jgi:hypothetical protein
MQHSRALDKATRLPVWVLENVAQTANPSELAEYRITEGPTGVTPGPECPDILLHLLLKVGACMWHVCGHC